MLAGKRGNVILDEFALHKDQQKLLKVSSAVTQWGGQRIVISTHRGKQSVFAQLVNDCVNNGKPDAEGRYHVTGAPANMGGLVNRAAFRTIQSLSASATMEGGENQNNNQDKNTMTEEEINALRTENETLKKQLENMKKAIADMQETEANDAVEAACKEGKISPSLKASWMGNLLKNPAAKELLASLPVNPAFLAAYKPEDNKGDTPKGKALLASYNAIEDPDKRLAFFQANEKELRAAIQ